MRSTSICSGRWCHDHAHLCRGHGAGESSIVACPREAQPIEGSTILEITWSIIPFFVMLTSFIWGAVIYLQGTHSSRRLHRNLRRRKPVDVEV